MPSDTVNARDMVRCDGCGQYYFAKDLFKHIARDMRTLWLCDNCLSKHPVDDTPGGDSLAGQKRAPDFPPRGLIMFTGSPAHVVIEANRLVQALPENATIDIKACGLLNDRIREKALPEGIPDVFWIIEYRTG